MADITIPEGCPLVGVELSTEINSKTTEKLTRVETELNLLKHDISIFDKYFAKIDVTVGKLGEVIEQIHRLVSVHDDRIEVYHQNSNELKDLMENRRLETFKAISDLEDKIDNQGERISGVIEDFKKEVLVGLSSSNTRIKKLELWRYLVIGGAIVVGLVTTQVIASYASRIIDPQITTIQMPTVAPVAPVAPIAPIAPVLPVVVPSTIPVPIQIIGRDGKIKK